MVMADVMERRSLTEWIQGNKARDKRWNFGGEFRGQRRQSLQRTENGKSEKRKRSIVSYKQWDKRISGGLSFYCKKLFARSSRYSMVSSP